MTVLLQCIGFCPKRQEILPVPAVTGRVPPAPSRPCCGACGWPWRAPPPRRPAFSRTPAAGRGPEGCPPPAVPDAPRRSTAAGDRLVDDGQQPEQELVVGGPDDGGVEGLVRLGAVLGPPGCTAPPPPPSPECRRAPPGRPGGRPGRRSLGLEHGAQLKQVPQLSPDLFQAGEAEVADLLHLGGDKGAPAPAHLQHPPVPPGCGWPPGGWPGSPPAAGPAPVRWAAFPRAGAAAPPQWWCTDGPPSAGTSFVWAWEFSFFFPQCDVSVLWIVFEGRNVRRFSPPAGGELLCPWRQSNQNATGDGSR